MIVDGILLIFQGALNILLMPITVLNIAVDFVASIPFVVQFLQVAAYLLPFSNLLPLIVLVFGIFMFRIGVALFRLLLSVVSAIH